MSVELEQVYGCAVTWMNLIVFLTPNEGMSYLHKNQAIPLWSHVRRVALSLKMVGEKAPSRGCCSIGKGISGRPLGVLNSKTHFPGPNISCVVCNNTTFPKPSLQHNIHEPNNLKFGTSNWTNNMYIQHPPVATKIQVLSAFQSSLPPQCTFHTPFGYVQLSLNSVWVTICYWECYGPMIGCNIHTTLYINTNITNKINISTSTHNTHSPFARAHCVSATQCY